MQECKDARKFYETYEGNPELAPLVRELPWAPNLLVLAKCKTVEERGFYLRLNDAEKFLPILDLIRASRERAGPQA